MVRDLILAAIRLYQAGVSPLLPSACRFTPSCSEYAHIAIARFGVMRGGGLAIRRLLRCHPFGGFGPDPVPTRPEDAVLPEDRGAGAAVGAGRVDGAGAGAAR